MSTYASYSGASGGGGGGSVGGSGASPQVAVWSSTNNITGSSGLLYASGNLTVGTTTPALNITSTSALGSGMQGFLTFNDTTGLVSYLGYTSNNDSKLRLAFNGGTATTNGTKAYLLSLPSFNGDYSVTPTESYTGTGNITSGSATISAVSSALTAKLYTGMRLLTAVILSDVVLTVDDATHFTLTTGSASYPTGGGQIVDQDAVGALTYTAYNAGTKQMTVASTTGMLAGDTTIAYIGIPFYATISSIGATTITMSQNATSTVTGISFAAANPHIGNTTVATPGSRTGADDPPLSIYYSSYGATLGNPQAGGLYIHSNDPYHTAGRTCGITFFGDGPLTTRGAGPAGCPIGALNFYVENDSAGPYGTGHFEGYVVNGSAYLKFLAADHSGNVTLGTSSSSVNLINGSLSGSSFTSLTISAAADSTTGLKIASTALTGTAQIGATSSITVNSASTAQAVGFATSLATAASSFTCALYKGFWAQDISKGATSSVTRSVLFFGVDPSSGATGNAIFSNSTTITGNYFLFYDGTNASSIGGTVTLSTGNLAFGTAGKGIVGTATNNSASAGNVGEYVESVQNGFSAYGGTTATNFNLASISLTAGDWDVSAMVTCYNVNAVGIVEVLIGISSSSTFTDRHDGVNSSLSDVILGNGFAGTYSVPMFRVLLSGTTTIYLNSKLTFAAGTPQVGYRISARRVR